MPIALRRVALLAGLAATVARSAGADDGPYDLVVVGGTPGGIACAVRAAREGLNVLLVNRHKHLGGMLSSGLAVWDTQYEGRRSPIYDEVRAAMFDHYLKKYGADSQQYRDALPGPKGYTNGRFEPRVAEQILDELVGREARVTVLRSLVPVGVESKGPRLEAIVLRDVRGDHAVRARGCAFVDATYEGDLVALAKVPYRVGREARGEYDESHAGVIFMRPSPVPPNAEAKRLAELHDGLRLRRFEGFQEIMSEGSGAEDPAVQACNYRTILTTDPANRVPIAKPANYDAYFLKSLEIFSGIESVPNGKYSWNRPQLVGLQTGYVEGDQAIRQRVEDGHWEATMGLLYFLQNDLSVPPVVRDAWRQFGLAKDEFADNGHRPYELYVREARRVVGRAVFTERDATLAAGVRRTPVQDDSVAMTEWYMDSHSCTTARVPGGLEEGKMMLHHETFPAQIPFRCLLPKGLDNLLVPVCLSATHVAWGTVRLEPVWMQVGEAAGAATALAKQRNVAPAALDPQMLVRRLCDLRSMISFFNDVDVAGSEPWIPAAQYFGTKGFFHDYDVRADEPLKGGTGKRWAEGFGAMRAKGLDPMAQARAVAETEAGDSAPMTRGEFAALLGAPAPEAAATQETAALTRGEALAWLWGMLR